MSTPERITREQLQAELKPKRRGPEYSREISSEGRDEAALLRVHRASGCTAPRDQHSIAWTGPRGSIPLVLCFPRR